MASDITIVMPAYNAAKYIDETLRSILAQSLKPAEIIVVDDGSSDDTAQRVKRYGSAVTLISCTQNSGGCGTPRNIGIDAAKTTWIVPFDSDDIMHPGKLHRHMATVRAVPEAAVVFSSFWWFYTPPGFPHSSVYRAQQAHFKPALQARGHNLFLLKQPAAFAALMQENYIGASALMFTKEAWGRINGYNPVLRSAEDFDFSLRLSEHFSFGYADEALHFYRIHAHAMSANRRKILNHAVQVLEPFLNKCPDDLKPTLVQQIADMEIDLIWHSLDDRCAGEALRHWWHALSYGVHRRRFAKLTARLGLHWAVLLYKRLARLRRAERATC